MVNLTCVMLFDSGETVVSLVQSTLLFLHPMQNIVVLCESQCIVLV